MSSLGSQRLDVSIDGGGGCARELTDDEPAARWKELETAISTFDANTTTLFGEAKKSEAKK